MYGPREETLNGSLEMGGNSGDHETCFLTGNKERRRPDGSMVRRMLDVMCAA